MSWSSCYTFITTTVQRAEAFEKKVLQIEDAVARIEQLMFQITKLTTALTELTIQLTSPKLLEPVANQPLPTPPPPPAV